MAGIEVGSDTVTVVAAGDIARTPEDGKATADLIESLEPDAVLALGDNAYESGTFEEYESNYDPTWGRFKSTTRPVPGNHEYETTGASGYFRYFRKQVRGLPYYAWDAGKWRMYALNCEVDCGRGSEQVEWLTSDLNRHADRPALAYLHEPYFTCSTRHPPFRRLDDIFAALDAANGQVLLTAHNHSYERFAKLDVDGGPATDGLREFVVGTGGGALYQLEDRCPDREAASDEVEGVLELELRPDSYVWRFIDVAGKVLDSGQDTVR